MNKEQTIKMVEMQGGNKDFEISASTEKKVIAGYNCIKYVCKDKNTGTLINVWATHDLDIPANSLTAMFKGVPGVPLQFTTNAHGMKINITTKTIAEAKVGDINMDVPKDYEVMAFDDLIKQMGG